MQLKEQLLQTLQIILNIVCTTMDPMDIPTDMDMDMGMDTIIIGDVRIHWNPFLDKLKREKPHISKEEILRAPSDLQLAQGKPNCKLGYNLVQINIQRGRY